MYTEVPCSLKLLYSLYTGREAQCGTSHNYAQSIPSTVLFLKYNFFKLLYLVQYDHADVLKVITFND
jgi:hypothetical protein